MHAPCNVPSGKTKTDIKRVGLCDRGDKAMQSDVHEEERMSAKGKKETGQGTMHSV